MLKGDQIKRARNRLKESQEEFGKRFGVDQTTIHRWETFGLPSRGPAKTFVEQFLANPPEADRAAS